MLFFYEDEEKISNVKAESCNPQKQFWWLDQDCTLLTNPTDKHPYPVIQGPLIPWHVFPPPCQLFYVGSPRIKGTQQTMLLTDHWFLIEAKTETFRTVGGNRKTSFFHQSCLIPLIYHNWTLYRAAWPFTENLATLSSS